MAEDDDAVETVVYECQQAAKQPRKFFHRSSSSLALELANKSMGQRTGGGQKDWSSGPRHASREHPAVFSPAVGGRAEISNYFWVESRVNH
jgi:hypothetical protein